MFLAVGINSANFPSPNTCLWSLHAISSLSNCSLAESSSGLYSLPYIADQAFFSLSLRSISSLKKIASMKTSIWNFTSKTLVGVLHFLFLISVTWAVAYSVPFCARAKAVFCHLTAPLICAFIVLRSTSTL